MTSAPEPTKAKAPAHAYTFKINEYDGDEGTQFFTKDILLDNTLSTNLKIALAKPDTSLKLVVNTTKKDDVYSAATEGTFVFPISKDLSSNGHPISAEFKFKPKNYNFTFSYVPFQLAGTEHWINPYIGVGFRNVVGDFAKDSSLTFGAILHTNGKVKTINNTQLKITNDGDDYIFNTIINTKITWNNLIFSNLTTITNKNQKYDC
jgi:hypothetical protein